VGAPPGADPLDLGAHLAGSPGSRRRVAPTTTASEGSSLERYARPSVAAGHSSRVAVDSRNTSASTRWDRMSAPWAPAFIRTAPPIVPGTEQAQANPRVAGVRDPHRQRRQGLGGTGAHQRAIEPQPPVAPAEEDGDPGPTRVGHQQVGAATDHGPGQSVTTADLADGGEVPSPSAVTRIRAGPPTRRVVYPASRRRADDAAGAPVGQFGQDPVVHRPARRRSSSAGPTLVTSPAPVVRTRSPGRTTATSSSTVSRRVGR
jgi:hypothetical protein